MPERKFGFEAMEASAKLRKSSIDCLSAASFEAARSEQLRLPAEGPLKRRDGSSITSTLTPLSGPGGGYRANTSNHTITDSIIAMNTAAEPQSFARLASSVCSEPIRLTTASTAVFNNSTMITSSQLPMTNAGLSHTSDDPTLTD